jgi:hypothetical protein
MTDQNKDFSPESVMAAVAVELRYNRDDLEVTWDENATPLRFYEVRGKGNKMLLRVYRSEAEAESEYRDIVHEDLFLGTFFDALDVERELLDAVAKVCNLVDLTSYLTVASREDWAMPSSDDEDHSASDAAIGDAQAIPALKRNQAVLLEQWLKDPVVAVWQLQGKDLATTMAVLIEQCSFDVDVLTKAIVTAMGGWRSLSMGSVGATTPEGYVIEATNREAVEYLDELFTSLKGDLSIH